MDTLKDKKYKQYDSLSRYSGFPVYYDTVNDKYVYGIMTPLNKDTAYVEHAVTPTDTLTGLAFKYYGRPDYYWVIGLFNNIEDCLITLSGNYKILKIPTISNISFKN